MTTSTRKLLFVGWTILSLVLGGLFTYRFFSAQILSLHRITVFGTPPAVDKPIEYIGCRTNDIVNWTAAAGGVIGIEFKAVDFDPKSSPTGLKEPPFAGGTPGVNQSMNCSLNSCTSLNINPKLCSYLQTHQTEKLDYKYWQALNGVWADGRIIIKW